MRVGLVAALALSCRFDVEQISPAADAVAVADAIADAAPPDGARPCRSYPLELGASRYRLEAAALSWYEAERACEAEGAHLTVVEAVNGREALSKIRGAPPDLILTDLDMPVMDGFEFIEGVRSDPTLREVPVVVLTTRGSDEDKRRAMAAGADAFLIKSEFSEEALGAAITRFLEVRSR